MQFLFQKHFAEIKCIEDIILEYKGKSKAKMHIMEFLDKCMKGNGDFHAGSYRKKSLSDGTGSGGTVGISNIMLVRVGRKMRDIDVST